MSQQQHAKANASDRVFAVEITDLSTDGRGVARIKEGDEQQIGKAVFVDQALPNESGLITTKKRRRRYDEATWQSREHDSPHRVSPKCEHFGVCGGCVLQHADGDFQIEQKQKQLLNELVRQSNLVPDQILPAIKSSPWYYRRRARLGAKYVDKKKRLLVGFRERQSAFVADLKQCEILASPLGSLLQPLAELISQWSVRRYCPQIEVAVADNATALVFRMLKPLSGQDQNLLESFLRQHDLQGFIQSGGPDTITAIDNDYAELFYELPSFDLKLTFAPTDFVQINGEVNQKMVDQAMALLSLSDKDQVLDLFCGLGNFTLPMATQAKQVSAIEFDQALLDKLTHNAKQNNLDNIKSYAADLNQVIDNQDWAVKNYDAALIDPPRSGAQSVCTYLTQKPVSRIAYVSCHPASLARDAKILVDGGYRLCAAGVADMFPQTAHVESMALFERH